MSAQPWEPHIGPGRRLRALDRTPSQNRHRRAAEARAQTGNMLRSRRCVLGDRRLQTLFPGQLRPWLERQDRTGNLSIGGACLSAPVLIITCTGARRVPRHLKMPGVSSFRRPPVGSPKGTGAFAPIPAPGPLDRSIGYALRGPGRSRHKSFCQNDPEFAGRARSRCRLRSRALRSTLPRTSGSSGQARPMPVSLFSPHSADRALLYGRPRPR